MLNKLTQSRSTFMSNAPYYALHSPRNSINASPFPQNLPLKFPKNTIRKQTNVTMLTQAPHNPEKSCLRIYSSSNRSRFFENHNAALTSTQKLARHPTSLHENYSDKRLANPGRFRHLSQKSSQKQVISRSFEDIGIVNNSRRIIHKQKPDPIVVGQDILKLNSSLQKVWREERRHRDNGKYCAQVLNWGSKPVKRHPYNKNSEKVVQPYRIGKEAPYAVKSNSSYMAIHNKNKVPFKAPL